MKIIIIIIVKNEKKNLCRKKKSGMGYCPFVLQEQKKLYCKTRLYCNRRGLEARSSVLQYTALYCSLGARQGWTVLQYSAQPSHNTVTVAATERRGAGRARRGRWARAQGALAGGTGPQQAQAGA